MNLHNVEFIKSVASNNSIIRDGLPQLVFTGKSNVGKSSVINRLLNRKQLARVSATPGKTIHINYFLIDKQVYLVDLPGYGYAKAAKTEFKRWSDLMETFFRNPGHITLAVMIVDSRHKPTADDVTMAQWLKISKCPFVILANKIDKVKNSEKDGNLMTIRNTLDLPCSIDIIPFSAAKGTGRDTVLAYIETCLES